MNEERPPNDRPVIFDEEKRRIVIAERLILQCKNKNEVTAHIIEQFSVSAKKADEIFEKAQNSIFDSITIDKETTRKLYLAQIDRVMQLMLDKEMYKAWIDAMNLKIKLTGTEAPQEVSVSAPFFQQYLEYKSKERLEAGNDRRELEPNEILAIAAVSTKEEGT